MVFFIFLFSFNVFGLLLSHASEFVISIYIDLFIIHHYCVLYC